MTNNAKETDKAKDADKVKDADKTAEQPSEVSLLRSELAAMKAKMAAAARGAVDETDHYCSDCGTRVKNADDQCPAHPMSPMHHGGIDPLTGEKKLIRVG